MQNLSFLPSEIARLVLGYLSLEGYEQSHCAFLQECPHLKELNELSGRGKKCYTTLSGKTLQMILNEYATLDLLDTRWDVETIAEQDVREAERLLSELASLLRKDHASPCHRRSLPMLPVSQTFCSSGGVRLRMPKTPGSGVRQLRPMTPNTTQMPPNFIKLIPLTTPHVSEVPQPVQRSDGTMQYTPRGVAVVTHEEVHAVGTTLQAPGPEVSPPNVVPAQQSTAPVLPNDGAMQFTPSGAAMTHDEPHAANTNVVSAVHGPPPSEPVFLKPKTPLKNPTTGHLDTQEFRSPRRKGPSTKRVSKDSNLSLPGKPLQLIAAAASVKEPEDDPTVYRCAEKIAALLNNVHVVKSPLPYAPDEQPPEIISTDADLDRILDSNRPISPKMMEALIDNVYNDNELGEYFSENIAAPMASTSSTSHELHTPPLPHSADSAMESAPSHEAAAFESSEIEPSCSLPTSVSTRSSGQVMKQRKKHSIVSQRRKKKYNEQLKQNLGIPLTLNEDEEEKKQPKKNRRKSLPKAVSHVRSLFPNQDAEVVDQAVSGTVTMETDTPRQPETSQYNSSALRAAGLITSTTPPPQIQPVGSPITPIHLVPDTQEQKGNTTATQASLEAMIEDSDVSSIPDTQDMDVSLLTSTQITQEMNSGAGERIVSVTRLSDYNDSLVSDTFNNSIQSMDEQKSPEGEGTGLRQSKRLASKRSSLESQPDPQNSVTNVAVAEDKPKGRSRSRTKRNTKDSKPSTSAERKQSKKAQPSVAVLASKDLAESNDLQDLSTKPAKETKAKKGTKSKAAKNTTKVSKPRTKFEYSSDIELELAKKKLITKKTPKKYTDLDVDKDVHLVETEEDRIAKIIKESGSETDTYEIPKQAKPPPRRSEELRAAVASIELSPKKSESHELVIRAEVHAPPRQESPVDSRPSPEPMKENSEVEETGEEGKTSETKIKEGFAKPGEAEEDMNGEGQDRPAKSVCPPVLAVEDTCDMIVASMSQQSPSPAEKKKEQEPGSEKVNVKESESEEQSVKERATVELESDEEMNEEEEKVSWVKQPEAEIEKKQEKGLNKGKAKNADSESDSETDEETAVQKQQDSWNKEEEKNTQKPGLNERRKEMDDSETDSETDEETQVQHQQGSGDKKCGAQKEEKDEAAVRELSVEKSEAQDKAQDVADLESEKVNVRQRDAKESEQETMDEEQPVNEDKSTKENSCDESAETRDSDSPLRDVDLCTEADTQPTDTHTTIENGLEEEEESFNLTLEESGDSDILKEAKQLESTTVTETGKNRKDETHDVNDEKSNDSNSTKHKKKKKKKDKTKDHKKKRKSLDKLEKTPKKELVKAVNDDADDKSNAVPNTPSAVNTDTVLMDTDAQVIPDSQPSPSASNDTFNSSMYPLTQVPSKKKKKKKKDDKEKKEKKEKLVEDIKKVRKEKKKNKDAPFSTLFLDETQIKQEPLSGDEQGKSFQEPSVLKKHKKKKKRKSHDKSPEKPKLDKIKSPEEAKPGKPQPEKSQSEKPEPEKTEPEKHQPEKIQPEKSQPEKPQSEKSKLQSSETENSSTDVPLTPQTPVAPNVSTPPSKTPPQTTSQTPQSQNTASLDSSFGVSPVGVQEPSLSYTSLRNYLGKKKSNARHKKRPEWKVTDSPRMTEATKSKPELDSTDDSGKTTTATNSNPDSTPVVSKQQTKLTPEAPTSLSFMAQLAKSTLEKKKSKTRIVKDQNSNASLGKSLSALLSASQLEQEEAGSKDGMEKENSTPRKRKAQDDGRPVKKKPTLPLSGSLVKIDSSSEQTILDKLHPPT